jgi:hypothetical protein
MIDEKVVFQLQDKYKYLDPLIFQRSLERATGPGDLFDILESTPEVLPIIWDENSRRWTVTDDLTQSRRFNFEADQ